MVGIGSFYAGRSLTAKVAKNAKEEMRGMAEGGRGDTIVLQSIRLIESGRMPRGHRSAVSYLLSFRSPWYYSSPQIYYLLLCELCAFAVDRSRRSKMSLRMVYVDERLIVLDKPSGLLAVPGLGPENQDNLASRLQREYPEAMVVHRLDRDTSGLILFARDPEAQRHLSRQFHDRSVEKFYDAVVQGCIDGESGRIELPLRKDFERPPRHRVDLVHGRKAVTQWRALGRFSDRTRVELSPMTGRSHQLRILMQQLGHPILGDKLYANHEALALSDRLLLHAARLNFAHPSTGMRMNLTAECPF
jgi:tRNA pseudouridine32 synthase/23S rRNA pseudouridine746 synthase